MNRHRGIADFIIHGIVRPRAQIESDNLELIQEFGKLAQTAIDFPPMLPGASFNLEAVKQQVEKAKSKRTGD